jgi:hypothetical protein
VRSAPPKLPRGVATLDFARAATNIAAALASPVAFLTDANCDADKGFFASATTCNAGSRSLAMAFRAQCFCWHLASCAGSGDAAGLVADNLIRSYLKIADGSRSAINVK